MSDRGPNIGLSDLVPSVRDDPEFTQWVRPIPPEWYSETKRAYTLVDQEALYGSLQFARFYGRTALETLATPTDVATRGQIGALRGGIEAIAVPVDGVVTARNYIRRGTEILSEPTDRITLNRTAGSLVSRPVDNWP